MPRLYTVSINMLLFRGKYRIGSIRLSNWDYTSPGMYFVTIVTKNNRSFFGRVEHGCTRYSPLGQLVCETWRRIPSHFKNSTLDEFVIMPNHIHGIIILENDNVASLSTIVGSFKSAVTKMANRKSSCLRFTWLPRFYDHIIRNDNDLIRIKKYIQDNPLKWDIDKENTKNF